MEHSHHRHVSALLIAAFTSMLGASAIAAEGATFAYAAIDTDIAEHGGETVLTWNGQGWIGGDFHKLWVKTEGERAAGDLEEAELQALYSRMIAPFWDFQAGIRYDFEPEGRAYATAGFMGLAPYWFEVDAAAFLSEDGDVSARLDVDYELLFTQRLIGSPYAEVELFAQDIPELEVGSGLATLNGGFQLRYEITRKFAPYVDINYERAFGTTADMRRAAGEDVETTTVRFGARLVY